MTDGIKITGLQVRSYAGLEAFDLQPGEVTILAGKNASGKTSVLAAIKAALERGGITDEAIRVDADRAEISVMLSDGTEVRRSKTRGGQQRVKVLREGMVAQSPQAMLQGLLDPVSLDPVAWLDGDRTQALLDAMPLETTMGDIERMAESAGLDPLELPVVETAGVHAVKALGQVEAHLAKERTAANAQVKTLRTWIAKEEAENATVQDPGPQIEETAARVAKLQAEMEAEQETIVAAEKAKREVDWAARRAGVCRDRVEDLRAQLAAAEKDLVEAEIEVGRREDECQAFKVPSSADDLRKALTDEQVKLEKHRRDRGAYEAMVKAQGKVEAEKDRLQEAEARAKALDAGVKAFRAAPASLLAEANLPVPGLSYQDGTLALRGVPIGQLSGAETIRLAAQVAVHRVRQQRGQFILLDGLEQLDDDQRAALLAEMQSSGVQWICTEVGRREPDAELGAMVVVMGG